MIERPDRTCPRPTVSRLRNAWTLWRELAAVLPRFLKAAAIGVWALAGLALYSATVFYTGWRVGLVEGAPVGGTICEQSGGTPKAVQP